MLVPTEGSGTLSWKRSVRPSVNQLARLPSNTLQPTRACVAVVLIAESLSFVSVIRRIAISQRCPRLDIAQGVQPLSKGWQRQQPLRRQRPVALASATPSA